MYFNQRTGADCHDPRWEQPTTSVTALWLWDMDGNERAAQDEEVAAAVRFLKSMAVERDVCVMVTSHLPAWTARADARPVLEDFGALGAVKQNADVVLAIYREEMYAPANGVEGATEMLVRKNRNGTTGYVDLYFYKQWLRFEDLLDPDR